MSHRLHGINYRVLITLLVVALPMLGIGAFLVLADARARLVDTFGMKLSERAEQSAAAIDAYVYRRIVDVSTLARVPDVRAEAERSSQQPVNAATNTAMDQALAALDVKRPAVAALLHSTSAQYFIDIARQDPIYRAILLTDHHGRLVAASNLSTHYDLSDEDWWKRVMADPARGEATVSDVHWDERAHTYAMEIAVPVPGPDERPTGVLKVVADVREMLASVAGIDVGHSGDAMIVRRNGSIVYSRGSFQSSARFFAADRLKERLDEPGAASGPARLFFTAQTPEGKSQIVGVATSQLATTYPHLPWVVVTWQSEDELLSAVESEYRSLLLVFALTVVAVLALASWFSVKLLQPAVETEMALVPHVPIQRVAEEETV